MRTRASMACGVAMAALLVGACEAEVQPPKIEPTGSVADPLEITFLAYGPEAEVKAMQGMVDTFNNDQPTTNVVLKAVEEREDVLAAIDGPNPPDVYLLSRRDIAQVSAAALNQPLDELLDARGVDFSDWFNRDALESYSLDNRLQCMPYSASPMVIYYNTELVDFEAMAQEGIEIPEFPEDRDDRIEWTLDQFAAAATWAVTHSDATGVYVEPSLEGIAPFVYSGGGELFDDPVRPSTLTLSSEATLDALTRTLDVLRSEGLSPTKAELSSTSALTLFKQGKLAMLAGYRNLVPQLRDATELSFDVMPMPKLESRSTVGDVTGLCMGVDPVSSAAAADFIIHASSAEAVAEVAAAGYLVPASNEVAGGPAFLQPGQLPAKAAVFTRSIRDVVVFPLLESWEVLETAVDPKLETMFYAPLLNLEELTADIDEISKPVVGDLVIEEEEKVTTSTPSPE